MRHVFYAVAVVLIVIGVALLVARPADRLRQGDIIPADCPGCSAVPRSVP